MVAPADIDETPLPAEAPADYVLRLAREKAAAIWSRHSDLAVLAADTTVVVDGEIFGKPSSELECIAMLTRLSAREHEVFTGVALHTSAGQQACCSRTVVRFRALAAAEMSAYWASGEPQGKAGAYAIQGYGAIFVAGIEGSYTGVMGLPLFETAGMLRAAGIRVWQGAL